MKYAGPAPDFSYYTVEQMRESEENVLSLYETTVKNEVVDDRRVLER
jgi:hypothetical protein